MTVGNSMNLVNITKNPYYSRKTGFFCVISNPQYDFVCHEIFVKSASEYFRDLLTYKKEDYEIEPGVFVPRIHVKFSANLLEEFFRFAYFDEMKITLENVEELLKFSSYINSLEMLALVEKFICNKITSPDHVEQLEDYFQVADYYVLEQFKQKLTTKSTIGSSV